MLMMLPDSNFLRNPVFAAYLAHGLHHKAILSDLVIMEMRKRNALLTSRLSLQILSAHLQQVFVLKDVNAIMCVPIECEKDTEALFDYYQGGGLPGLCEDLYKLPTLPKIAAYFEEVGAIAKRQIDQLRADVASVEPALRDAAAKFTDGELGQIQRMKAADVTKQKVLKLVEQIGGQLIHIATGKQPRRMKWGDALSMFAFRYALCATLYYLMWVRDGRPERKLEKRLNDIVDLQIAALGTFFGGVLTEDERALKISINARVILREMGAYVGQGPTPTS